MSELVILRWVRKQSGVVLAGVLLLLLVVRAPAWISAVWRNKEMLRFRDRLVTQPELNLGTYSLFDVLEGDKKVAQAMQSLRRAVVLDEDNAATRWALGRVALSVGDTAIAAQALAPLRDSVKHNFLLYHDVVAALSHAREPEDVIALYESFPPLQPTRVVSDTLALAHLEQGQTSSGADREKALARARAFRPGDLFINYSLWRAALANEDMPSASYYNEALVRFPPGAVQPTDRRLLAYVAQIVPDLLEAGLWDGERGLNVVSFLVWQDDGAARIEQLLKQLIEHYPTEPNWRFYLAEIYHRQGELQQAEIAYQQVLGLDPEYVQVYLRLGMVAEARSQISSPRPETQLETAARWYAQYEEIVPGDLFGLKRLAQVCTMLEEARVENENCRDAALRVSGSRLQVESGAWNLQLGSSPANALERALKARSDVRQVVGNLIDVPTENVELGPNLLENGGFEEWVGHGPMKWVWWTMFDREPYDDAAFSGGRDRLLYFEGRAAARVDGLWVQHQEGRSPARSGFWQWNETEQALRPVTLNSGEFYVFSFDYRTAGMVEGGARVWVSGDPEVFWVGYHSLPATGEAWHRFVAVGWNRSGSEAALYPFVSSFAPGSVAFDGVQVRRIELTGDTTVEAGEVRFCVIGSDDCQ